MKIYLDDVRETPQGYRRTYTAQETINILAESEEKVEVLSLDHDLGDDELFGTGYDVLKWIEEKVFLEGFVPPDSIIVHSSNPAGVENMKRAIFQIEKMHRKLSLGQDVAAES